VVIEPCAFISVVLLPPDIYAWSKYALPYCVPTNIALSEVAVPEFCANPQSTSVPLPSL